MEAHLPEGDTIYKLARRLEPLLLQRTLTHLSFRGRRSEVVPAGPVVTELRTVGKHLLIVLDGRRVLRVHLGLKGAFRRLGPQDRLPSPRRLSLHLETAEARIVCVRARTVELFGLGMLSRHAVLSQLGPDLLAPPIDWDDIDARLSRFQATRALGDVLLDQRIAAGIGNVFRNDLLFVHGLHPDRLAAEVPRTRLISVFRDAADQLRWNVDVPLRITTRDAEGRPHRGLPRHWVYGRLGEPCLRCLSPIAGGRTREDARSSFYCRRCQPEDGSLAQEA